MACTRSRALGLMAALALIAAVSTAQGRAADVTTQRITAADRDCSDFSTQAQAQSYFIDRGGPGSDPDRLDADGDGVACESNPCPCSEATSKKRKKKPKPKPRPLVISARIIDVLDGDTVRVRELRGNEKRYTVRLLGIDAPESTSDPVECGGPEATSNMFRLGFTEPVDSNGDGLFEKKGGDGRKVKLTTDTTQDKFDSFKRLLAYADTSDGQLNVTQVAAGWAKVYTYKKRVRQYDRLSDAQRRAKADERGVWGQCAGDFHREQR